MHLNAAIAWGNSTAGLDAARGTWAVDRITAKKGRLSDGRLSDGRCTWQGWPAIPILPMEQRSRAESALHARTNGTANNISVTFMAVPFSEKMRKQANALLKKWNIFWRFPESIPKKGGGRLRPVQGNDSRAFHTIPELLVQLFDIFYPEAAAKQVDEPLTNLGRAAAGATNLREPPAQQAANANRKRPAKRKGPPAVVGAGGSTSTTADVEEYRTRRRAANSSAAAPAAAAPAAAASVEAPAPDTGQEYDAEEDSDSEDEDDEQGVVRDCLPENAVIGGVRTAIDVWLTSIHY